MLNNGLSSIRWPVGGGSKPSVGIVILLFIIGLLLILSCVHGDVAFELFNRPPPGKTAAQDKAIAIFVTSGASAATTINGKEPMKGVNR